MNAPAPGPTTYGLSDTWIFRIFQSTEPVSCYVVADGMALFRGPDGHLWFAPDAVGRPGEFNWAATENLAVWDTRHHSNRLSHIDYLTSVAELCIAVDAAIRADQRQHATAKAMLASIAPVDIDL